LGGKQLSNADGSLRGIWRHAPEKMTLSEVDLVSSQGFSSAVYTVYLCWGSFGSGTKTKVDSEATSTLHANQNCQVLVLSTANRKYHWHWYFLVRTLCGDIPTVWNS